MQAVGSAVSLAVCLWCAAAVSAAERTPAQILRDIDAVKVPALDPSKTDKSYRRDQQIRAREAALRRARLIAELYKAAPDHSRIPALLEERWNTISEHPERGLYDELIRELEQVIARTRNEKLKVEASYVRARLKLRPVSTKAQPDPKPAADFYKLAPRDPRAYPMLSAAILVTHDSRNRAALLALIARDFPDSDLPGMLQGIHDQSDALGKRFSLEFADAISGSLVAVGKLKGKVVVVHFWATWSEPCVADMPHMKELYSKHHDDGVEFIGVSLDQPEKEGGLDNLKKFVKENDIKWPQYYQGNDRRSEFSRSWDITEIPRVFVVDADGKLYSVAASGKLDTMIPELLEKKKNKGASAPR